MRIESLRDKLKMALGHWESSARECQVIRREQRERRAAAHAAGGGGDQSARAAVEMAERKHLAAIKRAAAEHRFREALGQWESLYLDLEAA